MQDTTFVSAKSGTTCTCGHPETDHSACTGECYQCACKHYTPARKAVPRESGLLARIRRSIRSRGKPAGEREVRE